MISIFDLINRNQDPIIGLIAVVLGIFETGVCSLAIHKLIMDEEFLIYIIGHAMFKKTKNIQEALAHYAALRDYLKHDLFQTIYLIKSGVSIALVAGLIFGMSSMWMICMRQRAYAKRLWIASSSFSLLGHIAGFTLCMKYLVQNILYIQVFLATTGVVIFLQFHLILAVIVQEMYTTLSKKSNDEETVTTPKVEVTNSEAQTSSIAVSIQEEFPLPPSPPSPKQGTSANSQQNRLNQTSSSMNGRSR